MCAAIVFTAAVAHLSSVRPAAAQDLESSGEFWQMERRHFGPTPWRGYYRYNVERDWGWSRPRWDRPSERSERHDPRDGPAREPRRALPQVQVKSPQYYTYRPDPLETVRFDHLCKIETASNDGAVVPVEARSASALCEHPVSFALRVLPEVASALKAHYARHPEFIWVEDGRVSAKAEAALAALARSDSFGLPSEDYLVQRPDLTLAASDAPTASLVRFEVSLSARVLTYALDATRGRVDPNRISGYHDLPRKTVDLSPILPALAETHEIAAYLEARHPDNPHFRALTAELARLQAVRPGKPISFPDDTLIRPGENQPVLGKVIAAIRTAASPELMSNHAAAFAAHEAAERYTPDLVALVRDFQRQAGIRPDGIIGPNTLRVLTDSSAAEKSEKVRLAMERLRWLPRQFGDRHVFLNQPAFAVTYVENGRESLSMRAIIGEEGTQTHFFTDRIKAIEYNPYWGVPRSIIVNEMLPRLYRDPSYLDRQGYEVIAGGRRVRSAAVDWYAVAHNNQSVGVRQPPGSRNALGRLKIAFPNRHAIYMHDTPHKALFKRTRRAFSHGCVRLEDPRAMAAALLGRTQGYIDKRIATEASASEPVTADIPVYLAYFTAWPDAQGKVRYYQDVYERDRYLAQAMAATEAARRGQ